MKFGDSRTPSENSPVKNFPAENSPRKIPSMEDFLPQNIPPYAKMSSQRESMTNKNKLENKEFWNFLPILQNISRIVV